jgi:hypothetical protein
MPLAALILSSRRKRGKKSKNTAKFSPRRSMAAGWANLAGFAYNPAANVRP